jgi:hypothetical protein
MKIRETAVDQKVLLRSSRVAIQNLNHSLESSFSRMILGSIESICQVEGFAQAALNLGYGANYFFERSARTKSNPGTEVIHWQCPDGLAHTLTRQKAAIDLDCNALPNLAPREIQPLPNSATPVVRYVSSL